MQGTERRTFEGSARVGEFTMANPSDDTAFLAVAATIREMNVQGELLGIQQRDGLAGAKAASERRLNTRARIEFGLFAPLARVGRSAEKDAPELLGKFKFSRNATHKAFLIAGRSMLASATAARDVMIAHGLPTTLLADLEKALNKFAAEGDIINMSRRAHIGASAELKVVAAKVTELIAVMDGFNRYRFQDDPDQLASGIRNQE